MSQWNFDNQKSSFSFISSKEKTMKGTIDDFIRELQVSAMNMEQYDFAPPFKRKSRRNVPKGQATRNLNKFNRDKKKI